MDFTYWSDWFPDYDVRLTVFEELIYNWFDHWADHPELEPTLEPDE